MDENMNPAEINEAAEEKAVETIEKVEEAVSETVEDVGEVAEAAAENEASDPEAVAEDETNDSEKADEPEKKSGVASVFDIVEMFAACAAVILMLFTFAARLTVVDGPSMNKTLTNGDYMVVNSLCYTPKRGDIVVVQDQTARGYNKPLIKRLIAVGGDTVDIDFSTWTVTVNGEVLDESEYLYIDPSAVFTSDYKFPITIEEGKVFVMGDNRHHSADSRLSVIGQIDERCLVGHAFLRLLPFNNITLFN